MGSTHANGIRLEYEIHGSPADSCAVLIRGLSTQLIHWPDTLVDPIVAAGYRVLVFDNRDAGLSGRVDADCDPGEVVADLLAGRKPAAPYTLHDMADDTVALLSALGLERAHLVGMSMGGRIAQLAAARYPERARSLCSIMSSTGNPALSRPRRTVLDALNREPANDREAWIEQQIADERLWEGSRYPQDEEWLHALLGRAFDRAHSPAGTRRQLCAIYATGDQREHCRRIRAPTLVVHGTDDTLIPIDGGEDTAAAIPGSTFKAVAGMGHAIPPLLSPYIAELLVTHFDRAEGRTRSARAR